MVSSIFNSLSGLSLLAWAALACALPAAGILIWFLLRRPPLTAAIKILLLFGIGVLPIGAALTGNLAGYQRTTQRGFCGSCHTMGPYARDSADPTSTSLAAMHARSHQFGDRNCYMCHADYGMFGTVSTKLAGMRHVWEYFAEFRSIPVEEALPLVHLYRPYPNANCMQCHSTTLPGWNEVADHQAAAELIRAGELSCVGEGCHGPAHPFSKPKEASR
ncbi:NapC/NirT family cytochrome c [Haliangium sp.]|uniref:NapC/NirT family cytochrome c n=1 Tax=Haliangium sp. TaxID=2663208 RepID=UPI003D0E259C